MAKDFVAFAVEHPNIFDNVKYKQLQQFCTRDQNGVHNGRHRQQRCPGRYELKAKMKFQSSHENSY